MAPDDIIDRLDGIDGRLDDPATGLGRIDQRLGGIEARLDEPATGLGRINQRLGGIDHRLGGIDNRLLRMDERFDRMDERLDQVDERFDRMQIIVQENVGRTVEIKYMLRPWAYFGMIARRVKVLDGDEMEDLLLEPVEASLSQSRPRAR